MRGLMVMLVLGAVVAMPPWAPADEPAEEMSRKDITREQIEALHDLENAETDEDAEEAKQRFDDASDLEVQRRRAVVEDLIESGGDIPPSPRPPPPHP